MMLAGNILYAFQEECEYVWHEKCYLSNQLEIMFKCSRFMVRT